LRTRILQYKRPVECRVEDMHVYKSRRRVSVPVAQNNETAARNEDGGAQADEANTP
jgi:hypothetical protein